MEELGVHEAHRGEVDDDLAALLADGLKERVAQLPRVRQVELAAEPEHELAVMADRDDLAELRVH